MRVAWAATPIPLMRIISPSSRSARPELEGPCSRRRTDWIVQWSFCFGNSAARIVRIRILRLVSTCPLVHGLVRHGRVAIPSALQTIWQRAGNRFLPHCRCDVNWCGVCICRRWRHLTWWAVDITGRRRGVCHLVIRLHTALRRP